MPKLTLPTDAEHMQAILTVSTTYAIRVVESMKESDPDGWDEAIKDGTLAEYVEGYAPIYIRCNDDGDAAPVSEWDDIDTITFLLVLKHLDLPRPDWVSIRRYAEV